MPHYTLFVGNWQAFKMIKPGSRARSYSQVFVPSWLNLLVATKAMPCQVEGVPAESSRRR